MKAMVTTLTENESQITANSSFCRKLKSREEADTERRADKKRQRPGTENSTDQTLHSSCQREVCREGRKGIEES